jgi:hypothetical protein
MVDRPLNWSGHQIQAIRLYCHSGGAASAEGLFLRHPVARQGARVTPFKPVESRRLYEQIAEQIEGLIQDGTFGTGSKLPPERELTKMIGVSRGSIREAMIALETAKLIEVRVGDGTYVRSAPPAGRRFPWAGSRPGRRSSSWSRIPTISDWPGTRR